MSKDRKLLQVVEALSNEKQVDNEIIFEALEAALEMATKKRFHYETNIKVAIDRETGDYYTYRVWDIVDDDDYNPLSDKELYIPIAQALTKDPEAQVGGEIREEIASEEFGRIAAQIARQVLTQKVREAERGRIVKNFLDRVGQLVNGVAKKITRDYIFIDLGNGAEAVIPREDLIPKEVFRPGDRVRGYLYAVRPDAKGPQIFMSRTCPEMLIELFKIEVPEIGEGIIEVMSAARDPGARAKIAVKTNDGRIDPIGACVGMRGSRVQAVSGELCGERIDIVLWDGNDAQFVINALAPAEVVSIVMDEEKHSMDVAVSEEQLSQAIGRNGQNVRLASELTGWTLNVMSQQEAVQKTEAEMETLQQRFIQYLDVDEELAAILIREGFTSIEEIAYVPAEELEAIEEFDEEIVKALRERANDALLTQVIAGDEQGRSQVPAEDLVSLEGMTTELAENLAKHGIITQEDLAEQSVDELIDLTGISKEQAAQLIMTAREPWFSNES